MGRLIYKNLPTYNIEAMNLEFLVTRTIYENANVSQRNLAKKFFVSLGKINAIVNNLLDEGYINVANKNYEVSSKGIDLLNAHKVDSALILACGMGLRVSPQSPDMPICFLEINGKILIERQIEDLKSVGIDDITIMVGFMKEKFDYLTDKYGVKLIYNDEYKYKNTLSTLYHARDVIKNKNVYICASDVYMKENLYHSYEIEPYYLGGYYEDCKNEWRFIVNSKNKIEDVAVGGSNDFCFVGSAFLDKEFIDKLLPLIDDYYHRTYTNAYYWEDVLIQNLKTLPNIYLYKVEKDMIYDFDSLKDIEDFNIGNEENIASYIDFITKNLNTNEKEIKDLICVKKDVANLLYRFTCKNESYYLRVPLSNANEYIDRSKEKEILEKLKPLNIVDDMLCLDVKTGYKLSRYIKSVRNIDTNDKDDLIKCMSIYKKMHTSGIKVDTSADFVDKISEYLGIIEKRKIYVPYEDFDEVVANAKKVITTIPNKLSKVICHGNASPSNIFVSDDGLKLINFEYSGMANPITDIALFSVFADFDVKGAYNLYEIYKEVGENDKNVVTDDKVSYDLLVKYMALAGLYNAVWSIVRSGTSESDYGTLGMKGYRIFKNIYREHLK